VVYWFQSLSLKTRFLGVLLLLFPVLVFHWLYSSAPWALVRLVTLSGGPGVPDALWWYKPSQLIDLVTAWKDEGAAVYLNVLWPTDLGYLLSYSAFLTAAILYLLKKANPRGRWYLLPLVPLAAAACDLLENCAVAATVLWGTGPWTWLAPFFTSAKWTGIGVSGLVLLLGGITTLVRAALARRESRRYTDDDVQ
jgi:hypothetical protein